jgi:hypothetical protein
MLGFLSRKGAYEQRSHIETSNNKRDSHVSQQASCRYCGTGHPIPHGINCIIRRSQVQGRPGRQHCIDSHGVRQVRGLHEYLDTTWKKSQEAALKAGYITGYKVLTVEPRTQSDPDIYLIIMYKNWAALDDQLAKGDAITEAVEGSVDAANKAAVDRGKMRTVIGSQTIQELLLK